MLMHELKTMHLCYLLVLFRLAQANKNFSSELCDNISKIIVRYRDYYNIFLGQNSTTKEVEKSGAFYQYITKAVPNCCRNLTVEFIYENATELDTVELVMANLTSSKREPRPFVFYFPEFTDTREKYVYDFELNFVKLASSSGQAAVMYDPGGFTAKQRDLDTVTKIVKSSGLLMMLMLTLSWLFGILGWVTVSFSRWSFSLNFLPLVRAPIVSGQPTKNI